MLKKIDFNIENLNSLRNAVCAWASAFPYFAIFDSHKEQTDEPGYARYSSYDFLVGVSSGKNLLRIENLISSQNSDWLFGHISFEAFDSYSKKPQLDGFETSAFFVPEWVIAVQEETGTFWFDSHLSDEEARNYLNFVFLLTDTEKVIAAKQKEVQHISREEYIQKVEKIKAHILRGDIYEMNFCIDFFVSEVQINPYECWLRLNEKSPAPFSAFYRNNNSFLISASPERYIKKMGNKLISQPIKGTIARSQNPKDDENSRNSLLQNKKERAENIMIVDLVRNDLTRISAINSVKVEELCQLYTFKHVHQLISTIISNAKEELPVCNLIRETFPMGSMTGAPKRNAIKIASSFENFNRGLYSGSVGYISPDGDFDFNVIIRSILYNAENGRISVPAGSAITASSVPENEYDECLLKVSALLGLLNLKTF